MDDADEDAIQEAEEVDREEEICEDSAGEERAIMPAEE